MLTLPENIKQIEPRQAFLIRTMAEMYKGGRVLDVGCGNGKKTTILGKLGIDVLGIDIDENEIQKANASNHCEHVQFACRNIKDIHERFSGITLIEVLEHIDEPSDLLKEIARICEDDGFLIVTIPNGYCVKEMLTAVVHGSAEQSLFLTKCVKWFRKIAKRDNAFNDSQHVQWFTLKRIRLLLEDAGFTIQEEAYYSIWSTLLWVCVPWLKVPVCVKRFEKWLEHYTPPYLMEGWGFCCVKNSQHQCINGNTSRMI